MRPCRSARSCGVSKHFLFGSPRGKSSPRLSTGARKRVAPEGCPERTILWFPFDLRRAARRHPVVRPASAECRAANDFTGPTNTKAQFGNIFPRLNVNCQNGRVFPSNCSSGTRESDSTLVDPSVCRGSTARGRLFLRIRNGCDLSRKLKTRFLRAAFFFRPGVLAPNAASNWYWSQSGFQSVRFHQFR